MVREKPWKYQGVSILKITSHPGCLMSYGSKIHSKMYPLSWANTHNEAIALEFHDMVRNTKKRVSPKQNMTFIWNQEILNLCHRPYIKL